MLRMLLRAGFFILFALSVFLNVLALAGCFQRDLLREKDALIDRFEQRTDELARVNGQLRLMLDEFDKALTVHQARTRKVDEGYISLMRRYAALKAEVDQ